MTNQNLTNQNLTNEILTMRCVTLPFLPSTSLEVGRCFKVCYLPPATPPPPFVCCLNLCFSVFRLIFMIFLLNLSGNYCKFGLSPFTKLVYFSSWYLVSAKNYMSLLIILLRISNKLLNVTKVATHDKLFYRLFTHWRRIR